MKWKKEIILGISGFVLSIVITIVSGFFSGLEIFYLGQGDTLSGWPLAFRAVCRTCPNTLEAKSWLSFLPLNNIVFWMDAMIWFLALYTAWSIFSGTGEEKMEEGI